MRFSIKLFTLLTLAVACEAHAQVNRSISTEVKKNTAGRVVPRSRTEQSTATATPNRAATGHAVDSDVAWTRIIYKELDLDNDKNATLYYPEEEIAGQENLFRILLRQVAQGNVPAYEFLDGREIFTDEFKVNVPETLDRFYIPYKKTGGLIEIDPLDVPANEVLSYYIIEKWVFDKTKGHTVATVEAICPVLHRGGEFGTETLKYPMFWVDVQSLKPYLNSTYVFIDDFDNTPRYTIDDFFTLNMYEGEIYKTRNARNKSMSQLYPDDTTRQQVADSIQNSLEQFDKNLWAPTREEVLAAREAKDQKETELGEIPRRNENKQSTSRTSRASRGKKTVNNSPSTTGAVTRSVRDRKK